MPTRLASSTLVIRPSAWISLRILRSISSRFFDTRHRIPGVWHTGTHPSEVRIQLERGHRPATLLTQLAPYAQFYCAKCPPTVVPAEENSPIWIAILAWLARYPTLGFETFGGGR